MDRAIKNKYLELRNEELDNTRDASTISISQTVILLCKAQRSNSVYVSLLPVVFFR